ncbi:hypothetical protein QRX60_43455 [Amycolatopsis mongoliensis]|uniref:ASCH domain-containing protein n=1 Tax=Amycolatopsis mongoliensis TaxID=715475 RepID=A0A9Y2NDM2_9PSEU|nr:hypothetical protein [Amycolatopsis sp. 4-36]WIY00842.1 hypothetical protein QRX60_43455 [Amycolatopsis sp. 4-36]
MRVGTRLRTAAGVLLIESVDGLEPGDITVADARRAGMGTLDELLDSLAGHDGDIFRIGVRFDGADPRVTLRASPTLSKEDLDAVLTRLDRASRHGRWTHRTLRLIADHPGLRAAALAEMAGGPTAAFKIDVRKLKEMGLTESLDVGYRISPRGTVVLTELDSSTNEE